MTQVHDSASAQEELCAVVSELLPVARQAVAQGHGNGHTEETINVEDAGGRALGDVDGVLSRSGRVRGYEATTRAPPDACPAHALATVALVTRQGRYAGWKNIRGGWAAQRHREPWPYKSSRTGILPSPDKLSLYLRCENVLFCGANVVPQQSA